LLLEARAKGLGKSKHLKKSEADSLAVDFMEALQNLSLSEIPHTPEEVVALTRSGLRFLEGRVPIANESTPAFLRDLFALPISPQQNEIKTDLGTPLKDLRNPPRTVKGLHSLLVRAYMRSSPEEVIAIRGLVEKIKSLASHSVEVREQLVSALRRNIKGTPGPKGAIPRDQWDRIRQCSDKLRPVCFKILDFAERESTQPLPEIIGAVRALHPEWRTECDFLLSKIDLVLKSLILARIKKARTRGKASRLADALACEFAGFRTGPSYSMQIVEQARRSV
jgi:hypothetical protein